MTDFTTRPASRDGWRAPNRPAATGALRRHGSPALPSGAAGTARGPFPLTAAGPGPRRRLRPRGGALASVYCAASGAAPSLPENPSTGRSFPPDSIRLRCPLRTSRKAARVPVFTVSEPRSGVLLRRSRRAARALRGGERRVLPPSPARYKSAAAVGPERRHRLLTVRSRSHRRLTRLSFENCF
ncbi:S-phase kinase-associated protein 1 isoform X2 [Vidua chalybeata]|uniref:S-phase kinase-associated protein 1 isoform X2 n=1 Tax=Vidua chalybeata TaxID=81927 RepID=UPI0023A890E6|nr:S-phase kinase-associated protein 1 isoform X2 [Vidua chalybeata]